MPGEASPLLERLRRDADHAIAERSAAARAEADRVLQDAAAQRERQRAAAVGERERALGLERDAARARVAQETIRAPLESREAFLARVFAAAELQLAGLAAAPDLARRLAPIVGEALPYLPVGQIRVRCSTAAAPAVQAAIAALGLAPAAAVIDESVPLGAMLEHVDGTVRVDATFVARLRRMAPALSIDAVHAIETWPVHGEPAR
ncbi:MAG: V-type ATP synthase subunit E family protein [Gemmatimonadaceae bacterium]